MLSQFLSAMASARAWVLLLILLLAYISSILDRVVISFVIQPMKSAFGVSDTAVSYLGGIAFTLFYALLGLPIARYADRLSPIGKSRQLLIALGIAVWSIATILCGFASTYSGMFAMRVGVAVGEAVLGPVAYALLAGAFSEQQRGLALSIYGMGIPLGQGIAFWTAGKAVAYAGGIAQFPLMQIIGSLGGSMTIPGWQVIFLVVGAPGLFIAMALALLPAHTQSGITHQAQSHDTQTLSAYLAQYSAPVLWHCIGFGVFALYYQGCGFWFVEHFARSYGWNKPDIGAVYGSCAAVCGTLGLILNGLWSNKKQGTSVLQLARKYMLLRAGAVLMFVAGTLMPLMPSGMLSAGLLAVVCFAGIAPYGIAAAIIQDMTPVHLRAQMGGIYLLVLNCIAGAFGPILVSWITDYGFRDPLALRYSISIVGVVSSVSAWYMLGWAHRTYRRALHT